MVVGIFTERGCCRALGRHTTDREVEGIAVGVEVRCGAADAQVVVGATAVLGRGPVAASPT